MGQASQPSFEIKCADCEESRETEVLSEATTFGEKHQDHTGHDIKWVRADFDVDIDIGSQEVWTVDCDVCSDSWDFSGEEAAQDFYREHDEYTNHTAKEPSQKGTKTVQVENVKQLVQTLEETDKFENGVPSPLVVLKAETLGATQSEVQNQLHDLKIKGEVYEPTTGRLRST